MTHSVKIVWVYAEHLLSFWEPGILVHTCVTCRQQKPWCWISYEFPHLATFHMCLSSLLGKLSKSCVSPLIKDLAAWVVSPSIDDMVWLDLVSRRRWAHQGSGKTQALRRSGACPLGEVTRQWPLWYPLGAKYRLWHCAPAIMIKGGENLGCGGSMFRTWGPCRHTHTPGETEARLRAGPWGGETRPQAGPRGGDALAAGQGDHCLVHKTRQVPGTTGPVADTDVKCFWEPQKES